MKTHRIIIAITVFILLFFSSCITTETANSPMDFRIEIIGQWPADYKLYQNKGAGQYELLKPLGENTYEILIPAMRGGYSKFFFFTFNSHDPTKYKVLQIKKDDVVVKELSIRDIENMKSDKNVYKLKF